MWNLGTNSIQIDRAVDYHMHWQVEFPSGLGQRIMEMRGDPSTKLSEVSGLHSGRLLTSGPCMARMSRGARWSRWSFVFGYFPVVFGASAHRPTDKPAYRDLSSIAEREKAEINYKDNRFNLIKSHACLNYWNHIFRFTFLFFLKNILLMYFNTTKDCRKL